MRSIRLIPMVIVAAAMLLGLKTLNLISGAAGLSGVELVQAQEQAEADASAEGGGDMADNVAAAIQAARDARARETDQTEIPLETSRDLLLERLGERREAIEQREQDLDIREQLLEAAERRLEERIAELAALEERVTSAIEADEARENEEIGRLVQVYGAMRAKDAAAIFDVLDLPILLEVAQAMNPRKMADILGNMNPEAARRLTIAMAGDRRPMNAPEEAAGMELPQIEGVPIQ
ncbi:MAG: hypothetical protein AAF739_14495 [Pseudomonadota bacterium]